MKYFILRLDSKGTKRSFITTERKIVSSVNIIYLDSLEMKEVMTPYSVCFEFIFFRIEIKSLNKLLHNLSLDKVAVQCNLYILHKIPTYLDSYNLYSLVRIRSKVFITGPKMISRCHSLIVLSKRIGRSHEKRNQMLKVMK